MVNRNTDRLIHWLNPTMTAEISSEIDIYSYSASLEYYSVSYYDYIASDECSGFGWNLLNSTYEKVDFLLNPLLLRIIVLYLQPFVAVFGVIGNLAFIFIVFKVPYMRNRINTILLNLSVADLLYLLVGTGEKFVNVIHSPVLSDASVFGQICQCFIITPLVNAVSFISLLLVSVISVERYLAVCWPIQHLILISRRGTLVYVCFVWCFCFALAIFLLPSSMNFLTICVQWPDVPAYADFPSKVGFCYARNYLWHSISEIVQTFPFFFALMLNVVCYVKIVSRLNERVTSPSAPGRRQNDQIVNKHKNSATRMLLINGIAFCVLATPFHVTNALQFFEGISPAWLCDCGEFKDVSLLLLYLNSAVNPFIYGVTNRRYRQAYCSVFCQSRSRSRTRRSTATSISIYGPSDTVNSNV